MDNHAQEFARKIISALEDIKRLVHNAISLQKKEGEGANKQRENPDRHHNPSAPSRELANPQPDPSVAENNTSTTAKQKSFPRLRKLKPLIEVIGVAVIVIYTSVTIGLWYSSSEANRLTRENFMKEQRAYVVIDQPKDSNIVYMRVGEKVRWDIQFINFGKTPAIHMGTDKGIWLGSNAMNEMEQFFSKLPRAAPHNGEGGLFLPPIIGDGGRNTPGFQYTSIVSESAFSSDDEVFGRTHDKAVVIAGRTWYQDMDGNPHYTDFCDFVIMTGAIGHYEPHTEIH
jgi:hypothetical protein